MIRLRNLAASQKGHQPKKEEKAKEGKRKQQERRQDEEIRVNLMSATKINWVQALGASGTEASIAFRIDM